MSGRLHVTDITVLPDSRYGFEVWAGARRVVSFFFDDLEQAVRAAMDLRALLPSISSVLREARYHRPLTDPFTARS